MNMIVLLFIIIGSLAITGWIVFVKTKSQTKNQTTTSEGFSTSNIQIKPSNIEGVGIFASRTYNPGDIILEDLFPHLPKWRKIEDVIHDSEFQKYISIYGAKTNHCSKKFNSDIIKNDITGKYQLVSIKKINPDDEITANYNNIHKKYSFIGAAGPGFSSC